MTDRPVDPAPPADRMQRIINEQLRIMRKQLDLMRLVEPSSDAAGPAGAAPSVPIALEESPQQSTAVAPDRLAVNGAPRGVAERALLLGDLSGIQAAATRPQGNGASATSASLEPGARHVPLTDAQRDVWIICQLGGDGSASFNLSTTLDLQGPLDLGILRTALRQLVERHETLRSTVDPTGDHMVVHEPGEVELPVVDVSGLTAAERSERVNAFIDGELTVPYDLVAGPLFRATLLRSGPQDHTLVLSAQHLISDGWSLGVMQRDLGALYSALVRDERPHLDGVTQFRDFVAWRVGQSEEAEPYWLSLYDRPPVQLDLPTDQVRPPVRGFDYGTQRTVVGEELLPAIRDLATAQGVTPFIVLFAAWQMLLHRLSGQAEFASGVFVSGQASMGARSLVGLCTNLLPLRATMDPEEPLGDHLARLKRSTFEAFDNQHYALGNLASALQLQRDVSRPTLVSTVITLETPTSGIEFEGLRATESVHGRRRFGSFDFEAYLTESRDDLIIDFKYATALFEPTTIERWLGHYIHLLRQMTSHPSAPVSRLRLLDDAARQELLTRWNDTQAPVPAESTHRRFELQAARHPDRVAVRTSAGSLTYGELNARANRLARHLREVGF
jgi:hypothetical protein